MRKHNIIISNSVNLLLKQMPLLTIYVWAATGVFLELKFEKGSSCWQNVTGKLLNSVVVLVMNS